MSFAFHPSIHKIPARLLQDLEFAHSAHECFVPNGSFEKPSVYAP